MRARYYDPAIRRFINRDTLLGKIGEMATLNRFGYVNGNPVSGVDPLGMKTMVKYTFNGKEYSVPWNGGRAKVPEGIAMSFYDDGIKEKPQNESHICTPKSKKKYKSYETIHSVAIFQFGNGMNPDGVKYKVNKIGVSLGLGGEFIPNGKMPGYRNNGDYARYIDASEVSAELAFGWIKCSLGIGYSEEIATYDSRYNKSSGPFSNLTNGWYNTSGCSFDFSDKLNFRGHIGINKAFYIAN
jgi:hypothetical protein